MEFRFDHVGFLTPDVDYSFAVYWASMIGPTARPQGGRRA